MSMDIVIYITLGTFATLGIVAFIGDVICRHNADKRMREKGYTKEFVITCSAHKASWE
jgi:putative effector of murein hydrolase LrgA (UPF0299 family)